MELSVMEGRIAMKKVLDLQKRSQAERLIIAETLLSGVWSEMKDNKVEEDVSQTAVNCQVLVNRIVWFLNKRLNEQ